MCRCPPFLVFLPLGNSLPARTVPGVGLYFSTMHQLRSQVRGKPSALQTLLIGASARALAAATIIPFTVLKTRSGSGSGYQSRAPSHQV